MITKQCTIAGTIKIAGIGVHSGAAVELALQPAPVDHGIVFYRVDQQTSIAAMSDYIGATHACTCLTKDGITIATIEHLMATLSALGIDNLKVEINAAELPILDGSAAAFVQAISQVGLREQDGHRQYLKITRVVEVKLDEKWARLEPAEDYQLDVSVDFSHPVFTTSDQHFKLSLTPENFAKQIAFARTFGFLKDYEYCKANNLARGASLENTVVLDDTGVMNPEGLRDPQELLKHKVLDAIGDLALLGRPLLAKYVAYKPGHTLNAALVKQVLAEGAFDLVS